MFHFDYSDADALTALAFIAVSGLLMLFFIAPNVVATGKVLGKKGELAAVSGWAKFKVRLYGWKTLILTSLAGFIELISIVLTTDNLNSWSQFAWVTWFDQKTATLISTILIVLAQFTHAHGMLDAARRQPIDPEDK